MQCQGTCNLWRKDGFKGIWGDLLDELVTDDASGVNYASDGWEAECGEGRTKVGHRGWVGNVDGYGVDSGAKAFKRQDIIDDGPGPGFMRGGPGGARR